MTRFHTFYMDDALFELEKVINRAKKDLADVEFDTLVGTGFSGSIVIPALALAMGKKFVLIRKETDDSHHGRGRCLGELDSRWIFVDDFVSSGRTRRRVMDKIDEYVTMYDGSAKTEFVGQYMYVNHSEMGPRFEDADSAKIGYHY
jgi:orotate phosphoribosyltransferase